MFYYRQTKKTIQQWQSKVYLLFVISVAACEYKFGINVCEQLAIQQSDTYVSNFNRQQCSLHVHQDIKYKLLTLLLLRLVDFKSLPCSRTRMVVYLSTYNITASDGPAYWMARRSRHAASS